MKKVINISIIFLLFLASNAFGQITIERQVIGSTGGLSTGTSMTLSSTVGEPIVTTLSSGNIILTQGFHQPQTSTTGLVEYNSKPETCRGSEDGAFLDILSVAGCPGPYVISDVRRATDTATIFTDINLGSGNYMVTITGSNGCSVVDVLTIDLESDEECVLIFYSGITPNNDGNNDTWIIQNIELFPENTVQIFNRWGNQVWSGENYDNTTVVWEGFNNTGVELTAATYFYVAKVSGKVYKGWIELTR